MDSNDMEHWDENDSSCSDSEETGSSSSDESNSSSPRMEPVRVGGERLLLPKGLCDNPDIFKEFFSIESWNNFTDQQRQYFENFLPNFPENDMEEKARTLQMLFNRENIRFGNPLTDFHKQLRAGNFRPEVSRMRAQLKRTQYKDYKRAERWRMYHTMKAVLGSRQRLVNALVNGEKPKVFNNAQKKSGVPLSPNVKNRYFQELALIKEEIGDITESSEDENYPEGPLSGSAKKGKRSVSLMEVGLNDGFKPVLGTLSTVPAPWDQGKVPHYNPYHIPEQSYSQMLGFHAKRRSSKEEHPDLQTDGITLHDIVQRCSKYLKRSSGSKPSAVVKKAKVKVKKEPSISSPIVEEEVADVSDIDEMTSVMVKMEPDIEEEVENVKVDIEAMDDLPSLPIIVRQNSSISLNQSSSPKSSKPVGIKRQQRVESVESLKKAVVGVGTQASSPILEEVRKMSSPMLMAEQKKPPKVTILKTEPEVSPPKARLPLTPATLSDLDGIDMMDLPVDFDESPPLSLDDMSSHPELMQDTHACFFSLIRDILLSTPDHRIEPRELEARVKAWANSPIAPLNPWYSPQLESRLQSAVHFLTGDSSESVPEDYVPYMEWKVSVKAYQWIGAGRDSDHRLVALCSTWGERSTGTTFSTLTSATLGTLAPAGPPPPRGPAVQPTSSQDRLIFRQQEKQRYETPFRAFTYRVGGLERVVGPVRSTQAGNLSKARGHTLLVDDRPKYVTILELVRDAVARLPNAQGTRADIVTLLKDSQYLSESAQEAMLSSVVSGALDRLHYENDPSVKYDSKRKIWVYLHKGRSVEEFERLHALGANVKVSRPKSSRKPSKTKKDLPKIEMPDSSESRVSAGTETGGVMLSSGSGGTLVEGKANPKMTTVARKLLPEGGVKSLLGKPRGNKGAGEGLLRVQQQQQQQAKTSSILPARTIVQDTSLVRTQPHNVVKKSVTISADAVAKAAAGKSIVKVITTSQPSNTTTPGSANLSPVQSLSRREHVTYSLASSVRTVQRSGTQTTVSGAVQQAQQILQLKHQLLSSGDKIVKAGTSGTQTVTGQKKQSTTQTQPAQQSQQQVIVMKQQGSGDGTCSSSTVGGVTQQQMIVINQPQILMDPLSMKHQKQLQQILNKQQQQVDQQQTTQGQPIQLILSKQGSGDQGKVVATASKGTGPMFVMKEGLTGGKAGGSGGVQQMIFVKQQSGTGGEGGETTHFTQQQLQQMIVLKQQQSQGQQQAGTSQSQPVTQQMIFVKQQSADQKSVQVIPQSAAKAGSQPITLAQFQQQRVGGTNSLLTTHPRVVAHVSSTGGTSLIKPQVVTSGSTASSSVVAKVVPATAGATTTPIITMESLLSATATKQPQTPQATVRLPGVSRGVPPQYAVVSLPQQRVVQTTVAQVSGSGEVVSTSPQTVKMTTTQGVRIPGLNLTQIAGKQVLLASKPQTATIQGQNVVLGGGGGQALLVSGSGGGQQLALLQHGAQQILIPPGAIKGIHGLKVIPIAPGKNSQQGRQQVFARIINPSSVRQQFTSNITHDSSQQPPPSTSKE